MFGEVASLAAALIWSGSMVVFSAHGRGLPSGALNLYKNLVAVVCFGLAWLVLRPAWPDQPQTVTVLVISGVVGISIGDTALFSALKSLGAPVTAAIQCLAPPIAAIVAALALDELLTPRETLGMMITVGAIFGVVYSGRRSGAVLALLPRRTLVIGVLNAVFAAICQGVGLVLSRYALQDVDALSGTIVRIAPALVVLFAMTLSTAPWRHWRHLQVRPQQFAWLGIASFAGTFLGLLLMSIGVKYAKAGIAAALTSTYPIGVIPIAHIFLKERTSRAAIICTVVAVFGIILMMWG